MTIPANKVDEFKRRMGIVCNCAHIPPTMPTCRDWHLPDCPVAISEGQRRERERIADLMKNDPERLAQELAEDSFVATHGQEALDRLKREFG